MRPPLTSSLNTAQRHDRLQELIVELFLGEARREPLLLLIEDLQWADTPSLEVLGKLAEVAGTAPLLLLLNYRPEPPIDEPWANLPSTTRLVLPELSLTQSTNLLNHLLNGAPPRDMLPLLERSQGNPLFIEELVRSMVTTGTLACDEHKQWYLTRPIDEVVVPTSIQGLMVAYLDQLNERLYELVQMASVIGRRFDDAILSGVYPQPELLTGNIQNLIDMGLILYQPSVSARSVVESSAQDESPNRVASYLFRHGMLRDVAYESILFVRRRDLHYRVAQRIEQLHTGHLEEYLGALARHYLLAEAWQPAFDYNRSAGEQAQQRYANREALSFYTLAIKVIPDLPQTSVSPLYLIDLLQHVGDIHVLLGEYDLAEASYFKALSLLQAALPDAVLGSVWADDIDDLHRFMDEERGIWDHTLDALDTSRLDVLLDDEYERLKVAYLQTLHAYSEAAAAMEHTATFIRLHRLLANVYERRSDYWSAFAWLKQGMRRTTDEAQTELARCYFVGAVLHHRQGENGRALAWARRSLDIAEQLHSMTDQAYALQKVGNLWDEQGELSLSITNLEQSCQLFEQVNLATGLNNALNDLGIVYGRAGRLQDAIDCYRRSLEMSENVGDVLAVARTSNNMALALVRRGELERADKLYQYSYERFSRIGYVLGMAYARYNRGEVLLLQGQPLEALELFEENIVVLERINARNDLPEVLRLAAEASLAVEDVAQAALYANQSWNIAQDLGMAVEAAVAERVLAQIALYQAHFLRATTFLQRSSEALEELDEPYERGKAWLIQSDLFYAQGDLQQAESALNQARAIFRKLDAQYDLEKTNLMTEKIKNQSAIGD
ncbi:MAG: tetratricopeptide repeat protein [Chloroflexaceae bacterium]|nr:tetratricopeptide repeat protein [Chloroflexaceae bacterium]